MVHYNVEAHDGTVLPSFHNSQYRLASSERQFRPLSGREIPPSLFLILVEASKEYHVSIKVSKL